MGVLIDGGFRLNKSNIPGYRSNYNTASTGFLFFLFKIKYIFLSSVNSISV